MGQSFKLTEQELQRVKEMGKGIPLLESLAYESLILPKMHEATNMASKRKDHRHSYPYGSPAEFFMKHGQLFKPQPFPEKYKKWQGDMGACSINALLLAAGYSEELNYAEGFAIAIKPGLDSSLSPTLHAWCVDNEGNVVDPTWNGSTMGIVGQEYCGVVFKLLPLTKRHFSGKLFGFAFNHELFFKIITGEVTDWEKWLQPLKLQESAGI